MTHPARTTHRNIDTAQHRLAVAERIVPNVLDDIAYRKSLVGTSNGGGERTSKGGHSDPTANSAAELAALDDKVRRIVEATRIVLNAIDHLDLMCRDGLGRKLATADNEQQCPGWPVGNECGDLVAYSVGDGGLVRLDRDGLCNRCRQAKDAEERRTRDAERKRLARYDPKSKTA